MFVKRWPRAFYELGKLIESSECLSKFVPETSSTGVWATTYLLICLVDYISSERKQDTYNTQYNVSQKRIAKCYLFKGVLK